MSLFDARAGNAHTVEPFHVVIELFARTDGWQLETSPPRHITIGYRSWSCLEPQSLDVTRILWLWNLEQLSYARVP